MYDLDCCARLQDLCEELEAVAYNNPERKRDKTSIPALCKHYCMNCIDFSM